MIHKNVGILTFHNSRNYGAVLQAYALQKKMKELFWTVEIIDYRNPKIEEELRIWGGKKKGERRFYYSFLTAIFRLRKKISFDWFIYKTMEKTINLEKSMIRDYAKKFDVLVTGSDQVWNVKLTGDDKTYFLDFSSPNSFRIAYAVSLGDNEVKFDNETERLLHEFHLITLREYKDKGKIQALMNKEISICCDPTLLVGKETWKKIASARLKHGKYIFLFLIDESKELVKYAQKLAKRERIVVVSNKNDIRFFVHPSPKDFLAWVRDAEYIITNSFHGTIFSLLFEKKFVSLRYTNNGNSKVRIMELLERLNLEHRFLDNKELDIDKEENWTVIGNELSRMGIDSWRYILDWSKTYMGGE